MSLAGLFAVSVQTEQLQTAAPFHQGEGEDLDGLTFLDAWMALLAGDSGPQSEEEAALETPESQASGFEDSEFVNPLAVPDQPFSSTESSRTAKTLAAPQPDRSELEAAASVKPAGQDATGALKAGGQAESPESQEGPVPQESAELSPDEAAASQKTAQEEKDFVGGKDAKAITAKDQVQAGPLFPPRAPEPAAQPGQGEGSSPSRSGRQTQSFLSWEAVARPVEADAKTPLHLLRIIQGSLDQSSHDPKAVRSSFQAALHSQTAQLSASKPTFGASADAPPAKDAQTVAAAARQRADNGPKTEGEPAAKEGRELDSSQQRHAALRSGTSSASSAASSHSAPSSLRFADLLQAQQNPVQPGVLMAEEQPARVRSTGAGESLLTEATALRGQEADQVFSQVVQNARLLRSQGETRFEVRLKPEFLGKIQIESRMGADQKMTTRFLVEDPDVKALLESRLPLLSERLIEGGVRMASLEVQSMNAQGGGDSSRSAGETGQNRQQQGSGAPDPSRSSKPGREQEDPHPQRHHDGLPGRIHLVA